VNIYDPHTGLRAVLAIDNVACGPSIGGIRMAPDVTEGEAFRLARAMTFKNAAAGLAHGGGKAVIQADPKSISTEQKEKLIRSFAIAIKDLVEYIPGPDMGTDEVCMAWIKDEINRSVGLPREVGGIPLDEIGATGVGLAAATQVGCELYNIPLSGARLSIQGFGAVGKHAARFLAKEGTVLVAAADSKGTIFNSEGLDVAALIKLKDDGKSVVDFPDGEKGDADAIIKTPCDIWIPAARPDVINESNMDDLDTKLIVQGANIPITIEAEKHLFTKGIHVIPDFIANAGGVICAAVEYHEGTEKQALAIIQEKVSANTRTVLEKSIKEDITPRNAADQLAKERVEQAMLYQRR
jgi:glutamate dehydrogenase (NAD(P)+)